MLTLLKICGSYILLHSCFISAIFGVRYVTLHATIREAYTWGGNTELVFKCTKLFIAVHFKKLVGLCVIISVLSQGLFGFPSYILRCCHWKRNQWCYRHMFYDNEFFIGSSYVCVSIVANLSCSNWFEQRRVIILIV